MDEHRLEIIRRVKDPIRLRRQPERRKFFVVVELIPEFDGPALFREALGAGAAHAQGRAGAQRGSIGQGGPSEIRFKERQAGEFRDARGHAAGAEIVDHDHRQVGTEVDHIRVEQDIALAVKRSWQEPR